jgi:pyocin large subunit-like protein
VERDARAPSAAALNYSDPVKRTPKFTLLLALVFVALALFVPEFREQLLVEPPPAAPATTAAPHAPEREAAAHASIGFRSERGLDEHFEKHGSEFGNISRAEYLRLAQALRDAPEGGAILEARRADGVITRFDKRSGAFLAFNADGTLRTFFKPNDGQAYFRRQLEREPER